MRPRRPSPIPTVSLAQAQVLIRCLAASESILVLAPPGVGKSEMVQQTAHQAGLEVRTLLGTQIAPEDVSGVPMIVNQRTVFCPPRVLLGDGRPFCLFLDELPACPPEVQKAFYSLLLERRIGEHKLPAGTWVVAAGNRSEDRALVRPMSRALLNRVFQLVIRVDRDEWLAWARWNRIRADVMGFVSQVTGSLQRIVPPDPVPYSTPRAWALLSRDLDLAEASMPLTPETRRALAFGRLSAQDAALFCALCESGLHELSEPRVYLESPDRLPKTDTGMWFLVSRFRAAIANHELGPRPNASDTERAVHADRVEQFLRAIPEEFRFALLLDHVEQWSELGATEAMLTTLREVTGL